LPRINFKLRNVNETPGCTLKCWRRFSPSRVILPAPSTTVLAFITYVFERIVTGFGPQLNVTSPPPFNAVCKALLSQLAGVPVPTTPASGSALAAAGTIASTKATIAVKCVNRFLIIPSRV